MDGIFGVINPSRGARRRGVKHHDRSTGILEERGKKSVDTPTATTQDQEMKKTTDIPTRKNKSQTIMPNP